MKVLCVSCDRLAEMGSYRVDAGVLVISCSRCGAEMRAVDAPADSVHAAVEGQPAPVSSAPRLVVLRPVGEDPAQLAAEAAVSSEPFAAPAGRCPKCIAPRRPDAETCSQCGLTFVNFVQSEVRPPPPLDRMWRELLLKWDDAAAHDQLLAAAVAQSALPSIGRLYTIRCAVSPDDPQARRGRDEVVRRAMASASAGQMGEVSRAPRNPFRLAFTLAVWVMALFVVGMIAWQIYKIGTE